MIKKLFRQMLLTQILSAMTVMICMLIDSIMIGRFLGVDSMTAYGLASPVLMVFAAIGSMLTAGIQVRCGKTMGVGDVRGTNACFSVAVVCAAVVSVVGVGAVFAATGPLATLLGAGAPSPDNEVYRLTCDYLRGFIIGAPAFLFAQIMVPFMQMSGSRVRLITAVGAMTVFDVVFDVLNVTVVRGGMFGMGLASSLSYYIAFFIGIVYFFKKDCMFKFSFSLLDKKTFGAIVAGGIPTVVNQICLVLMVFVFNQILLSVGGNVSVAAYSVVTTVGNICYSFCFGVGSVALMLSTIFYTDEDATALRGLVKTMTYFAVVLCFAVTAVTFAAAHPLVTLFLSDDADAVRIAATGLRLFALSLVPSALNSSFKNYFQGIGRVGLTQTISVMQSFVYPALFAFVLSRFIGTTGVFAAYICGECATLLSISVIVFVKQKKISLSAKNYSLIPDGFGGTAGDCLEMTVKSVGEAVEASEKALAFCLAHGEDRKTANAIALCIEEMADNIVEHGFVKDTKKDHSVDVRLLFKESGKRVIRMRDNCVNFDPVKYLELHKTDDPTAHIGIRIVMAMTKEANYVNSLGLNNLTLTL